MNKKLAIAGAIILALVGSVATVSTANAATPETFTYAGDSLTARPDSWMHQISDASLKNVGGYALSGATSGTIAAHTTAHTADVLVIEVGTNDVNTRTISALTIKANILSIIKRTGHAKHVLIIASAPDNRTNDPDTHLNRAQRQLGLNAYLATWAAQAGWLYADPFSQIRMDTNTYRAGYAAPDGVHPTAAGNKLVASQMALYIHQALIAHA